MARTPRLPQGGQSLFDTSSFSDQSWDDALQILTDDLCLSAEEDEESAGPYVLIVCADGGSRGNPGQAAYGALVKDAATGEVLNREGLTLGIATNNVAEYSGLIAGLEMARAINPHAALEVRMDSKLVIEQMAGRWKTKHADMKPLALAARRLCTCAVAWVWVPRSENKEADALVNAALDGAPVRRK